MPTTQPSTKLQMARALKKNGLPESLPKHPKLHVTTVRSVTPSLSRLCLVSATSLSRLCHALPRLCHSVTSPPRPCRPCLSRLCHVSATSMSRLCHVSATSLPGLCHVSVTSLPRSATSLSLCHIPTTSLSSLAVTSLPSLCHVSVTSLPCICHVSVTSLPRLCHVSATSLPRLCHVSVMSLPCICHVSAMSLPRLCHVSATSLPRLWNVSVMSLPRTSLSRLCRVSAMSRGHVCPSPSLSSKKEELDQEMGTIGHLIGAFEGLLAKNQKQQKMLRPTDWHGEINSKMDNVCMYRYANSTAQGGGGSFREETIGEVSCCDAWKAERIHWWTDRWLELYFLEWLQRSPHPQVPDVVWV